MTRWLAVSVAAWVLLLGAAAMSGRVIPARTTVILIALAHLLGAIGVVAGAVTWWRGAGAPAVVTLLMGLVVLAPTVAAYARAAGAPRLNDVTTDPDDPPGFRAVLEEPRYRGRSLSYPRSFVEPARAAYSDVAPVRLEMPPDEAFAVARDVAEAMWDVTAVHDDGVLEAAAVTRVFRFRDDVVIRVRADGDGSRIDARSRSRDGNFDFGVNAARLRRYLEAVRRAASEAGGAGSTPP